jgi:hypothetical protein
MSLGDGTNLYLQRLEILDLDFRGLRLCDADYLGVSY